MNFNTFLIQIVCFSCVLFLFRAQHGPRGWVMISSFILLVLAALFLWMPDRAGWISGGLWTVLVLLPLLGYARVNRLVYQEQFGQARSLAALIRWLHPLDGYVEYPKLLRGLELGQQGKVDEAVQIFKQYQTATTPMGRMAMAMLYRMMAHWQDAITWMRQNVPEETLWNDTSLGVVYLRSLGETGDINGLLQGLERLERKLEKTGDVISLNLIRMFALAFCGQVRQVESLFNGPLSIYSDQVHQFWVATAELAAGHQADQQLLALRDRADVVQKNAIDWRLAHPPLPGGTVLTDSSRQILAQIETAIRQEAQYNVKGSFKEGQVAGATYALVGANLLMFATEIALGGSENPRTLYRLGALVPERVFTGEWWRLLNATFLHFGIVHLLANMLALYFFGIFIESKLGMGRFLIAYFFCGIGSMLTIATLAITFDVTNQFSVGASGAIMGLVGVMIAIFLQGWRRDNAKIAGKRLLFILSIVGLQTISDLLTPQVSLMGHVSGLILGFLIGSMLVSRQTNQS